MGEISLEELQLATRNHGMPLEALRFAVTPVGLHYLLVHYDIPQIDPAEWSLEVTGLVEQELSLSLEELAALPSVELVVTMECAGNGRARMSPRRFGSHALRASTARSQMGTRTGTNCSSSVQCHWRSREGDSGSCCRRASRPRQAGRIRSAFARGVAEPFAHARAQRAIYA